MPNYSRPGRRRRPLRSWTLPEDRWASLRRRTTAGRRSESTPLFLFPLFFYSGNIAPSFFFSRPFLTSSLAFLPEDEDKGAGSPFTNDPSLLRRRQGREDCGRRGRGRHGRGSQWVGVLLNGLWTPPTPRWGPPRGTARRPPPVVPRRWDVRHDVWVVLGEPPRRLGGDCVGGGGRSRRRRRRRRPRGIAFHVEHDERRLRVIPRRG